MIHLERSHLKPLRSASAAAVLALVAITLPACKAFKVDVGTSEPIKLDPIKFDPIDIKMKVEVYQYTGSSKSEAKPDRTVASATEGMRNRMEEIKILKNSRWVGENHLGRLSIRHLPAGTDGTWTQKVVNAENEDRDLIMAETAKKDGTLIEEVRRVQWENRKQNAWEGVLVEIAGDKPGEYRWVQKPPKGAADAWLEAQKPDGVEEANPVEDIAPPEQKPGEVQPEEQKPAEEAAR